MFHAGNLSVARGRAMRRRDTFTLARADDRACAVVGKEFEQARIRRAPVEDHNRAHAAGNGIEGGFGLGDHAACDGSVVGEGADLICGDFGDDGACAVLDPFDIGEQQKPVGLECCGDGAGGVVLTAESESDAGDRGVLTHHIRTDGTKSELLHVDGGVSSTGTIGHVRMLGNQVFRHAVTNISSAIDAVYAEAGISSDDVDWCVPHQANQRILSVVAKRMKLDENKVVSTVSQHGNTSAASIPLAVHTAVSDGRIEPGHLVLSEAMGGGFSWGASLFRI